RYIRSYVRGGFLPAVPERRRPSGRAAEPRLDARFFQALLRQQARDASLRVTAIDSVATGPDHSILTALTAWRSGARLGRRGYRLRVETARGAHPLAVMVKLKARDTEVVEVGQAVARLCDDAVGQAYARFRHRLPPTGCDRREVAIYGLTDERFRRHRPAVYGRVAGPRRGRYRLRLEDLSGLPLLDSADDPSGWGPVEIVAALRRLAALHAAWYRRPPTLPR